MQVSVILLAAGLGQRMGADVNKIWLPLGGKPLLQYSLEFFAAAPQVSQIILVAHAGEVEQIEELAAGLGLQNKAGLVVEGGSTRLRSVAAALPYISCTADLVAVHDAARPLLTQADWQAVLQAAAQPEYLGAILAAPVTDTIKLLPRRQSAEKPQPGQVVGPIEASPPRELLWRALTPQVFAIEPFIEAYSTMAKDFTDDAALLAASVSGQVAVVYGSPDNIKITTPRDLQLAELILAGGDSPCE